MMKKILTILVFAAGLIFSGCQKKNSQSGLTQWMQANEKVKVLSTLAQIGDLVQELGGERIDGIILIPNDLNPHSYELVKGDGEKFSRADLIFYNGLGLEHGASLSALLHSNSKAVALGNAVRLLEPKKILEKDGIVDPHLWMDVALWQKTVDVIAEHLIKIDPVGASYYTNQAGLLKKKMEETHLYMRSLLQAVPSQKRFLVTSHDAFRYFAMAYLTDASDPSRESRVTAPEGLAPDGQLNPIDIQRTIQFLKEHQLHVVFPESNVSRDAISKVAAASREFGYEVRLCPEALYGDSTSGHSYLDMMRHNAEVIARYIQKEAL